MKETIIALYHGLQAGGKVIDTLIESGFEPDAIGIIARGDKPLSTGLLSQPTYLHTDEMEIQVIGLWLAMCLAEEDTTLPVGLINMGIPPDYAAYYVETLRHYGILIALTVKHEQMQAAIEILRRYNPIDVEDKLARSRHTEIPLDSILHA